MIKTIIAVLLIPVAAFYPFDRGEDEEYFQSKYIEGMKFKGESNFEIISVKQIDGLEDIYFILLKREWYNMFHVYAISKNDLSLINENSIDMKKLSAFHIPVEFDLADKIFPEMKLNKLYYFQHVIY